MMQKKNPTYFLILSFSIFLSPFSHSNLFSQDYLGFANSAFAGVNGIDVNPASIVNNHRKWDITVIGLNVGVANNYLGFQKRALEHTGKLASGDYPAFNDDNFAKNYFSKPQKSL